MGLIKSVGLIGVGAFAMFFIFIFLVILVVAFLGFMPILSDMMGTNKPKDLGVTKYSAANYASGLAKVPGHTVLNPEDLCITCNYTSTGSVPVNNSFTSEEFTAQVNKLNSEKGPLRDVQVKFNEDGTIETSGQINDPNFNNAFYAKGRIVSASGKQVVIELDQSEVGRLGLSGDQAKKANDIVNQTISDFFDKNPGLNITSLSVGKGVLNFVGTFPQNMTGDPNSVPEDVFSKYS
jgi:hypothetical protein